MARKLTEKFKQINAEAGIWPPDPGYGLTLEELHSRCSAPGFCHSWLGAQVPCKDGFGSGSGRRKGQEL